MQYDIWTDICNIFYSEQSLKKKYENIYGALRRLCTILLADTGVDYSDFFSRLQAVCRLNNYSLYPIDAFRWRARQIVLGTENADKGIFLSDMRVVADAVAHFTKSAIPYDLDKALPQGQTPRAPRLNTDMHKCRRFVAVRKDGDFIYAVTRDAPDEALFRVSFTANPQTIHAAGLITEGMQFNALTYNLQDERTYVPTLIVIDPDFLIDITSLAQCVQPYGDSAFNYLVSRFKKDEQTAPIMLGNIANQFLDDILNNPKASFHESMRKAFANNALSLTACPDVDDEFMKNSSAQHDNILSVVNTVFEKDDYNIMLEPTFFCESLGIQGRMDCLAFPNEENTEKNTILIELKSGKWNEQQKRAREEHLMQMILYKEVLYFNLGIKRHDVQGYLLYSKYPHIQEQRSAVRIIEHAMTIRNNIVMLERALRHGMLRTYMPKLYPDYFNRNHCYGNLWDKWCKPELAKVLNPLHTMDSLTEEYFHTFLKFICEESYLGKTGDGRLESTRGMSNLWNADYEHKVENGDILADLRITEIVKEGNNITAVVAERKPLSDEDVLPNFREGDSVILYVRNKPSDTCTNKQVVRASYSMIDDTRICLNLRFQQSSDLLFNTGNLYAVEHDFSDAAGKSLFTGLHSLLCTDEMRRQLILCQRRPHYSHAARLLTSSDVPEHVQHIICNAKKAEDFYLLMGPPGTGKTNVVLRGMVREFMAEGKDILLMAYTNRAVDEICSMLNGIDSEIRYVRFGNRLTCAEEHRQHLFENLLKEKPNRNGVRELIDSTHVFVSTVASMNGCKSLFSIKRIDVALFDEAAQILEPQILDLLCHRVGQSVSIGKFIMIGDQRQLPAVVALSESRTRTESPLLHGIGLTDCRNSLFERLYRMYRDDENVCGMLDRQGRMHPAIADFVSEHFYSSRLQPVPVEHQKEVKLYQQYAEEDEWAAANRFCFIDTHTNNPADVMPKMNLEEARWIARIIIKVSDLYTKNGQTLHPASDVGIIVPFRRQIAVVRQELFKSGIAEAEKIVIDTVERYQGSQRNIIIYGTTISQEYEIGILSTVTNDAGIAIDRKLNVAITRARKQLFVLGDKQLLMKSPIYRDMISYCDRCRCADESK